jgi:hypothetical protein
MTAMTMLNMKTTRMAVEKPLLWLLQPRNRSL